ncbi:unnamed protein product [Caenorhabditis bovis]|uniref:Uncharacterized protein n=1 Tax=Caenorhabditis bovis TaxID=2654633 RepID=A0A8S1E6T7_9PELO|nr:unnamed protein product [Caenorhabditis bovis]
MKEFYLGSPTPSCSEHRDNGNSDALPPEILNMALDLQDEYIGEAPEQQTQSQMISNDPLFTGITREMFTEMLGNITYCRDECENRMNTWRGEFQSVAMQQFFVELERAFQYADDFIKHISLCYTKKIPMSLADMQILYNSIDILYNQMDKYARMRMEYFERISNQYCYMEKMAKCKSA